MDLNAFWALVESSAAETSGQDERLEWLTAALSSPDSSLDSSAAPSSGSSSGSSAARSAGSSSGKAVEFALRLDEVRRRVDTWAHWQAAEVIFGGLSPDDGFFYFQAWLVGQGRAVFEPVASSPDALADLPHVRHLASRGGVHAWADDDWPAWEGLGYVAAEAFDGDLESVLDSRGLEVLVSPEPVGERWDLADPAEISARIPRLGALFGRVA